MIKLRKNALAKPLFGAKIKKFFSPVTNAFTKCKNVIGSFFGKIFRAIKAFFYGLGVNIHDFWAKTFGVKAKSIKRANRGKNIFLACILAYPILHFIVFYIILNGNSILMAFQTITKDGATAFFGLENFKNVFHDIIKEPLLVTSIKNSVILYASTLFIGIPCNIIFSYFVYRKVPGHNLFKFVLFLPSIISSMILCIIFKMFVNGPIREILINMGLKNVPYFLSDDKWAFPTIVFYSVWVGFATGLILYTSAMNRIPTEIMESGRLDGLTMMKELWYVVIPLIFPTMSTMIVLGIAQIFTSMGPIYAMYGDSAPNSIYTIGYFLFVEVMGRNSSLANYPYASAAGIIFTCVAAPLTLLVKYLLEKYGPISEF